MCAGPYRFVERVAQGKIVFERFADYWDKANIHIDRVEFVPITRLHRAPGQPALGRSPHDRARLARPTSPEIRGDSRLKVVGVPELGYQMIPLNVNNGPKSKALGAMRACARRIDLAIDRETLVKAVFNNEYIPGNQWVSPSSPYYNAKFPVAEARRGQGPPAPARGRASRT